MEIQGKKCVENHQLTHSQQLAKWVVVPFRVLNDWLIIIYTFKEKKYQYHNSYDDQSIFSQDIPEDSCQDWWAIGYHIGVIKRESSGYYVNNFHMYKHTLQNKDATEIRVEATDEFGRKYVQTKITGDYDYSEIDYN